MGIFEQLTDYCDCIEAFTQRDVDDLVNIISFATCWTQKPCENFLFGERTELIDLPSCMDCVYEFDPFYAPFDPDSFKFEFVKQEGMEEEITEVDAVYSTIDGIFRMELPLPSCKCNCKCKCGCDPVYKLKVTYNAGYEEIPECLLPVFCNLIEMIHAKNSCDCGSCVTCENKYDENDPTAGIKYYKGDLITVHLETDFAKELVSQYKKQLAMISLCNRQLDLWGIVV